jgi:hypothetical protein
MNSILANPQILALIIANALALAQKAYDAFTATHGRAPTLEEWNALNLSWKSPQEIEDEVKAQLAGGIPAKPLRA